MAKKDSEKKWLILLVVLIFIMLIINLLYLNVLYRISENFSKNLEGNLAAIFNENRIKNCEADCCGWCNEAYTGNSRKIDACREDCLNGDCEFSACSDVCYGNSVEEYCRSS